LKLDTTGHQGAGGCLFFQTKPLGYTCRWARRQADNQILGVVEALLEYAPRGGAGVKGTSNMRVKSPRPPQRPTTSGNSINKTLEDRPAVFRRAAVAIRLLDAKQNG
jgi:PhoH-like ATPase